MLSAKTFLQLVGTIFSVIGTLHLLRLLFGLQIILVGWEVPVWLSLFGAIIAWYLAYTAFTLAQKIKNKK
jgi:hypothetical protein